MVWYGMVWYGMVWYGMVWYGMVFIPNRTFLVRFGDISGEFGRAKIPMARPNKLDMLPKRTKKGAIRYLPYPNSS